MSSESQKRKATNALPAVKKKAKVTVTANKPARANASDSDDSFEFTTEPYLPVPAATRPVPSTSTSAPSRAAKGKQKAVDAPLDVEVPVPLQETPRIQRNLAMRRGELPDESNGAIPISSKAQKQSQLGHKLPNHAAAPSAEGSRRTSVERRGRRASSIGSGIEGARPF